MISNEGVGDAVRDGLRGANHSNSLAIARICNDADRPRPRLHTREEIVNTFLGALRLGVLISRPVPVPKHAGCNYFFNSFYRFYINDIKEKIPLNLLFKSGYSYQIRRAPGHRKHQ